MDIKSLVEMTITNGTWNIGSPSFVYNNVDFYVYVVQKGEEMRIDLVIQSIYDNYSLEHLDVILYINSIDNPLNIREGMTIFYPPYEEINSFRYYNQNGDVVSNEDIKTQIAIPNKTKKIDNNRKEFIKNGYSLPPVVLDSSNPSVTVNGDKINVGGIK